MTIEIDIPGMSLGNGAPGPKSPDFYSIGKMQKSRGEQTTAVTADKTKWERRKRGRENVGKKLFLSAHTKETAEGHALHFLPCQQAGAFGIKAIKATASCGPLSYE